MFKLETEDIFFWLQGSHGDPGVLSRLAKWSTLKPIKTTTPPNATVKNFLVPQGCIKQKENKGYEFVSVCLSVLYVALVLYSIFSRTLNLLCVVAGFGVLGPGCSPLWIESPSYLDLWSNNNLKRKKPWGPGRVRFNVTYFWRLFLIRGVIL